ncbi:MAG: TadE/TadG family type IV pilus assembly protein [Caulobacteraceae bacterium]
MKKGLVRRWAADMARRFLRNEGASISPLFALMLIPICGVMAMAVEMGNGVLLQRVKQHAADSAVLAAARGNDQKCYPGGTSGTCGTGTTKGYVLEAKAVATKYPIADSSVSTIITDCPGSNTGANDCYSTTITRTVPFYLGQMVGMRNMSPTAVAFARTNQFYDLCFATTGDFTTDGKSTGFDTCYVESFSGKIKCTSVNFAGLFTNSTQACNGEPTYSPGTKPTCPTTQAGVNPCLSGSIPPAATVPCQTAANAPNPANWTWTAVSGSYTPSSGTPTTSTTSYVRLCGGTVNMSVNWNIAAIGNNQAIILDNTTISGGGAKSISASGTTIISTCTSACTGGTLPAPFSNLGGATGLTLAGPKQDTGTFANFALYDDETKTTATAVDYSYNINVVGEMYQPNRDIQMDGSQSSSIGGITCTTMVSKTFYSNGGKLLNNPVTNCAGNYLTAQQSISNVALVK